MNKRNFFLLIFILTTIPFFNLLSHEFRIEKDDKGYILLNGHKSSSHEGEEKLEYNPLTISKILCFDENGKEISINTEKIYPIKINSECPVIFVSISSGFWTKTPYGTKNIPKNEEEMAVESWESFENVKRINRWSENLKKPLTDELEIIPESDPFTIKTGKKIRLTLYFHGKPASNVNLSYNGKPKGTTGEDGKINVIMDDNKFQDFQASLKVKSDGIKADYIIYTTSLNFEK